MQYYPRDFLGHGRPNSNLYPKVTWPKGAKIAVQFVLNYEEGGERCLLHGDLESEAFLSEIIGASAWPKQRHWNMESIYEYGAKAGFWRIYDFFTKHKLPVTIFGVANALRRAPDQLAAMQAAGWEIANHGLKWIEYKDFTAEQEIAYMEEAVAIQKALTGKPPLGWYLGRCSAQTIDLMAKSEKFCYLSDDYSDDLPYYYPYQANNGQVKTQLIIPYTLDNNDMRFATNQGFHNGEQFFQYLKDGFDILYNEGQNGNPKMMSIGLHCRLIGRPGRMAGLIRFIEYIMGFEDIWVASRAQIAEHWLTRHPYKAKALTPSKLDEAGFMEYFGGVYEHSPFIAKRAFAGEIAPACDSAVGMAQLLGYYFNRASHDERLGVLNAHPDLAGKLAVAKKLTKESSEEQQNAGLDVLSDAEKATFTRLNDAYKAKFNFPFIIAVKGLNKMQILEAFQNRINNDVNTEFETACRQVMKIANMRIAALFE